MINHHQKIHMCISKKSKRRKKNREAYKKLKLTDAEKIRLSKKAAISLLICAIVIFLGNFLYFFVFGYLLGMELWANPIVRLTGPFLYVTIALMSIAFLAFLLASIRYYIQYRKMKKANDKKPVSVVK